MKIFKLILSILLGVPTGGFIGVSISLIFIIMGSIPYMLLDLDFSFMSTVIDIFMKSMCAVGCIIGPFALYFEYNEKETK
jgi:hypothetical protein